MWRETARVSFCIHRIHCCRRLKLAFCCSLWILFFFFFKFLLEIMWKLQLVQKVSWTNTMRIFSVGEQWGIKYSCALYSGLQKTEPNLLSFNTRGIVYKGKFRCYPKCKSDLNLCCIWRAGISSVIADLWPFCLGNIICETQEFSFCALKSTVRIS